MAKSEASVSLLQRLKNCCGIRTSPEEERRGAGRFPSAIETTCRLANVEGAARLSARVRNVSRQGISLLVNAPFAEGDLLTVDVPGASAAETALACVIYVAEQEEETWSIGCNF